ncbi:MAG TPA: hypothetical protein VIG51_13690 [Candidatus Baltobacteraceae bacterium]
MTANDTCVGHTLFQADPELFKETLHLLKVGRTSVHAHVLADDERAVVRRRLSSAVIRERCECSQPDCRTYRFEVPEKAGPVEYRTVRFHVRGECLLHVDSDGDIYGLERLIDDKPGYKFERQLDDSWLRIDV